MVVTVSQMTHQEKSLRSQSLTTPMTSMVRAKVFHMNKKTTRLRAKAQEFVLKMMMSGQKEALSWRTGSSTSAQGTRRRI
ncbi:hypothetical protein Cni_G02641 [Canna indica]|uniref:Uncharacterized protein n=1 Tax=Canna indica TaxID=4628 RepID=A0AAQ3Q2C8_9LILI|nr:hypothetical protein Cni_G02641 [Canna indica]